MADGSLELSVIKIDPRITWIKDQIVIWLRNLDSESDFDMCLDASYSMFLIYKCATINVEKSK